MCSIFDFEFNYVYSIVQKSLNQYIQFYAVKFFVNSANINNMFLRLCKQSSIAFEFRIGKGIRAHIIYPQQKRDSISIKQEQRGKIQAVKSFTIFMIYSCCIYCNIDKIKDYRMGCSSPTNAGIPNIPSQHLNRLLQVSDIHHPLNVNKKYEHLAKINEGGMIGEGFKKTFGYDCLTTIQELKSKRKQFWQTRVNGSPECWTAIKLAVEQPNQQTGTRILQELRIFMLNNNIQMCVDQRYNKYQVPVFCINEPLSIGQETIAQKNLNFQYSEQSLQVKIRSVRWPTQDISLTMNSKTLVGDAKNQLRIHKTIPDTQNIRFFYNGREMINNKTLGNYSYAVGTIIQAMIR